MNARAESARQSHASDRVSSSMLGSFFRLGRELSGRPKSLPNRVAYWLFGDLNVHRRVRSAHVLSAVKEAGHDAVEVLDAGCGEGTCSFTLARELIGSRVTAIDSNEASVATCRAMAEALPHYQLKFEQADVTNLPYVERFDVAVCADVLEHVVDDEAALANLNRALKLDGRLVVHVPLRHQLQQRFLPTHNGHHVVEHVRDEYLQDEIVGRIERAGFRVERAGTTFGAAGELAFELNTLPIRLRGLHGLLTALTYPLALALGYMDVALGIRSGGNSLLIVARKTRYGCFVPPAEAEVDPTCISPRERRDDVLPRPEDGAGLQHYVVAVR